METRAVRLYGKKDLRLETFELPQIKDNEILAKVVSDSLCMSSYKAAVQGADHKRVPDDIDENPTIIGHEFCGEIIQVGKKYSGRFSPGDRFTIQPAVCVPGRELEACGYSYKYCGGDATYVIIPSEYLERECVLRYNGKSFFHGSIAEPVSCIIGAFHASYHTERGSYEHKMGIVKGGKLALLAAVGPMGLGAIDYAMHAEPKPSLIVVTDIDDGRLKRAASIYTEKEAEKNGIKLVYVNTSSGNAIEKLMEKAGGTGYDDVFVFAPVKAVVEQGNAILAEHGCLNFFAGPTDKSFSALINFYDIHYSSHQIVGTSGGNTADLKEAIELMSLGVINPASMIPHIGGLDSAAETTLSLPDIPGGKKLVYTHIQMPMTAIADFASLGESSSFYRTLADICEKNNGLWSVEAETYLLKNAKTID